MSRRALAAAGAIVALAAVAFGISEIQLERLESSYQANASERLSTTADRLTDEIHGIESSLDSSAERLARDVGSLPADASRDAYFQLLGQEPETPRRGERITTRSGDIVAWWGEQLPAVPCARFCFDVTNVYIVARREVRRGTETLIVQRFARIPNEPDGLAFDPEDPWIAAIRFHAGPLRAGALEQRFIVDRGPATTLFVNIRPRPIEWIEARFRARQSTSVAILLVLTLLVATPGTDRTVRARFANRPWVALATSAGIVVAVRVLLLGIDPGRDSSRVFGFATYGSKMLGPFTRSPFDLFLTTAAILAIAVLVSERAASRDAQRPMPNPRWRLIARALVIPPAAYAFVRFLENLVANSRISPIPEHILPASAAQGFLLASLLALGLALGELARHTESLRRTVAPLAIIGAGTGLLAYTTSDDVRSNALLLIGATMAALVVLCALVRAAPARIILGILIATTLIVPAIVRFQQGKVRRFISETWAPLVAGESGRLDLMIHDALDRGFLAVDLARILPDRFPSVDLGDLAWELWSRSDLAEWQIPSSITIFDLHGRVLSRFGVGIPQLAQHGTRDEETLLVGSAARDLMHRDFDLRLGRDVVAEASVHIVNPTDPGATSFVDSYRELFRLDEESWSDALHAPIRPVVFDSAGTVYGRSIPVLPQAPGWLAREMRDGEGRWVQAEGPPETVTYLQKAHDVVYAFPMEVPTEGDLFRRVGSTALWAMLGGLVFLGVRNARPVASFVAGLPRQLGFRARASLSVTLVVLFPLLLAVLVIRAFLAQRLETEYLTRGQTALHTAQRVVVDYLASTPGTVPEEILDDEILTWLARVIGHDLHLYRDDRVVASSRRDLFSSRIESPQLPGDVYAKIVLEGSQAVLARRQIGRTTFFEIYSPITLIKDRSYTLALPFIVQARQIENEVDDLATTIHLFLFAIFLVALIVAYRTARAVIQPVQELVGGARAIASGDFDVRLPPPGDPDLRLLVATFTDMAQSIRVQQDELRQQRDRLQTLLENIDAGVVVLDDESHVVASNHAARQLFECDDKPSGPFAPPFEVVEELANRPHDQPVDTEVELVIDDKPRAFRVSVVPLPGGGERMLIAEDVTEILHSNRLQAWAEMARQVAHEIKNPLTPIQLSAEHLRTVAERGDPALADAVYIAVENILRQVDTLRETSRDFSDYASLREPDRKPVAVGTFLEELAGSYRHSASGNEIRFELRVDDATPRAVSIDARMIRGAIANLIENALQATPRGGEVTLAAGRSGGNLVVSVTDTGPGIAPDLLVRIFDPYFSTKTSGTGLGLAIARKSIEDHGGRVSALNLDEGFRVIVELPIDGT